jgi:hypothetical protein
MPEIYLTDRGINDALEDADNGNNIPSLGRSRSGFPEQGGKSTTDCLIAYKAIVVFGGKIHDLPEVGSR